MMDVVSTYVDVSGVIDDFGYKPDTKLAEESGEFKGKIKNV